MSSSDSADPNSKQTNDANFAPGGSFDRSRGRNQTRLFAEAFHRHVKIDARPDFSVLDVGCALGDALPEWRKHYPRARLYGCDFSSMAIHRCRENYGSIAQFYCARFEEITDRYDIIYCSNVLEHFTNYVEIAELLHRHCDVLFILVPHMEYRNGRPITAETDYYHKATLNLSSFDELASSSRSVSGKVIRAPGAWSPSAIGEIRWWLRRVVARRPGTPPRQALFELRWTK